MSGQKAWYGAAQPFKAPVRAASTGNIADLTAASVTQDGVTLVAGDRVLLWKQTSGAQNGIYVVGTVATGAAPLTRAADAALATDLANLVVKVREGTLCGDHFFSLNGIASDAITVGSTALVFTDMGDSKTAVFKTIVTVSSAELLALNATPKTLIAAPGAGLWIEPINAHAFLDYNSAAYAGIAAGEDLTFKWTNASGAEMMTAIEATGFLDQTSDQHRITYPANLASNAVPEANAAIVLHMSTGEVTTGNSPLKVEMLYRIRTLDFA